MGKGFPAKDICILTWCDDFKKEANIFFKNVARIMKQCYMV